MRRAVPPLVALALALAACGTNRPEIPPELLENPASTSSCSTPGYPAGPYGNDEGTTAGDLCFQGWRAPQSTPHTADALENISLGFADDPTGKTHELLLLNTAAVWCSVCKTEHRALPGRYTDLAPHGLAIVSALFQNNASKPAELSDLKTWVETFDTPFPMVLDPDYQLGTYGSAEAAPLNIVIDARTMQILAKFIGDQDTDLWQLITDELARREGSE